MRGSPRAFIRNIRASQLPLPRRLALAARNYAYRFTRVPPRECCGREGDPGC